MSRELVVLAKRRAAQGRGLGAAREKAAARGGALERILRGTGDGRAQVRHNMTVTDLEPDWTLPPVDEARYLGWYDWEQHLGPRDRWRLAFARAHIEAEQQADFALCYARLHASAEFHDDLREAGDDPAELARVRLEAELDSYPSR